MLAIHNLEVVYNQVVRVLGGVSLRVDAGETVALLGPNGAGKTTLLRALTGLLPIHNGVITKGRLLLEETELAREAPERIVRAGLVQVMEGRRIFTDLSVEDNLRAGAHTRRDGEVRRDLDNYFTLFPRLAERRRQQAGFLSGGEQQMLAIARALMAKPRMLLLDEPSLGLSPLLVAEVGKLIRVIQQQGIAILLVEQNAALALSLAARGYVLEGGKVVIDGPAQTLREDPDVQEFYLGGAGQRRDFRQAKHYRRKRRWLS